MDYNDFVLLPEKDYKVIRQNYDDIMHDEMSDLREIYEKMRNQRQGLAENNVDGVYDDILKKIDNNLSDLGNIIQNNDSVSARYHDLKPQLPIFPKMSRAQQSNDNVFSPYRSIDEINNHGQTNNNLGEIPMGEMPRQSPALDGTPRSMPNGSVPRNMPNGFAPTGNMPNGNMPNGFAPTGNMANGNMSNGFAPTGNAPPQTKRPIGDDGGIDRPRDNATQTRRVINSPLQSSPFANFIKKFNLMSPKNRAQTDAYEQGLPREQNYRDEHLRTRPFVSEFRPPFDGGGRRPHNRLVTNQIDIIRLLLLYMALRPNCRYCSRLATISSDELEVLSAII